MPSPATLPAALVLLTCLALPAIAAAPPGPPPFGAPPFGAPAKAALKAYDDALAEADAAYDRAVAASAEPAARDAAYEGDVKSAREKLATELAAAAKAATDAGDAGEAAVIVA